MTPFTSAGERDETVTSFLRALLASSGGRWSGTTAEFTILLTAFAARRMHPFRRAGFWMDTASVTSTVLPRSRSAIRRAGITVVHRRHPERIEVHRAGARKLVDPNQLQLFDVDGLDV